MLQIIAGQLSPSSGVIVRPDDIYYIPQHFGQYDEVKEIVKDNHGAGGDKHNTG